MIEAGLENAIENAHDNPAFATGLSPEFGTKPLKASKTRIQLRDGRELQYHRPQHEVESLSLDGYLPQELRDSGGLRLEVEIGPGKGEFMARRAARFTDRFFVGIDRRLDRFRLTEKKLSRSTGLDSEDQGRNWRILREDARSFLNKQLPPIEILHVYHPDPWPKARQNKHRFFRSPDARAWAEAIVKGGQLRLSTDHAMYFEEIMDICLSWDFLKPRMVFQKQRHCAPAQTHFEGIFLRKNEPVYKAIFERR